MTLEEITQTVQTGADLKAARESLGLDRGQLARALRMQGSEARRHLMEMERGDRKIGGTVAAAVGLMLELRKRS